MSESADEQPSTGVLGRIGSWFSPWKVKGPQSPAENASPSSDRALESELEEESEEFVRPQAKEKQREEEQKVQSSNPHTLGPSRDNFDCEEGNATQSDHRAGSVVHSAETREAGPRGEEFVGSRKKRTGQGKEWEESSNGTLASGNSDKNASHVTDLSSEQGVIWDSPLAPPQAQRPTRAKTGRRLHVYLEETSVIQCSQDTHGRQEVVRTKVPKSLQVVGSAKSSPTLDLPVSSCSQNKRTNLRPIDGTESYNSAIAAASLTSNKDSEPKPEKKRTEADSMGRKNTPRRKSKKNAQGDGRGSPHGKNPPSAETAPEGSDRGGKSPKNEVEDSTLNSSSKPNPTSQVSPECGESKTYCLDPVKQLGNFQESVTASTQACVIDGAADMEGDDCFYKVERKTETPESKRRSMKVSVSEVKFFTKNVPLNPKQSAVRDNQDLKLKTTKDDGKDKPKTVVNARQHDLKKTDDQHKPLVGGIAGKISLFEHPAVRDNKQTPQTPRSADPSPNRNATERLKEYLLLSEQRSKSVERYDTARSNSASPSREKPITIKERMRTFTEASKQQDTAGLLTKSTMTGMSQNSTTSPAASAPPSRGQDSQGKLETKDQIKTESVITLKPDGLDPNALGGKISITTNEPADSRVKNTVASRSADQSMKPNDVEANVSVREPGDSVEVKNDISPQSTGPSRTSSRPKRRKSRESANPVSPNNENEADLFTSKPVVSAVNQEPLNETESASASRKLPEKVSLPDKGQGHAPDKQPVPDTKPKKCKKELELLEKQEKPSHSSFIVENIDELVSRQEPEPSVRVRDEPDTAAHSRGTKTPIKGETVISAQKEETTGGHSLSFTQESEKPSKDSKEGPASPNPPVLKQAITKPKSSVKHSNLGELPVKSEQKSKEAKKVNDNDTEQMNQPQNKDTELISQNKDKGKLDISNQTNRTEKTETPHQLPHSTKNIKDSDRGQNISEKQGIVPVDHERKERETQSLRDRRNPESRQPEPKSESPEKIPSILPAQTQDIRQTTNAHPQKSAFCAITQANEEALSGTKGEKELSKGKNNETADLLIKSTKSVGMATDSVRIAAEPQSYSALVEQTDNAPDDSCTQGANGVELSTAKPITKATTAFEEVPVKATRHNPVLITAKADSMLAKDSCVKEPTLISASKSVGSELRGQDDGKNTPIVTLVPSEVKISGDTTPAHSSCDALEHTDSTSNQSLVTSLKGSSKMEQHPAESMAIITTADMAEKTAERTFLLPIVELSPVGCGDISPQPQLHVVKEEMVNNKSSQVPNLTISPEANKMISDSVQHSTMKKFNRISKDHFGKQQDTPSSWLDVDLPKQRLKVPPPRLSSSGSESNLLDTSGELDDYDFIEKINNLCAPFSLPPRKHNTFRPPQPPFVMPAIKEDRFEKTFDAEEFKFGLRKTKYIIDTPSTLANLETKSGLKPARASLADRSILLSSLDTYSRLKTPAKDDKEASEEKEDQIKVKSRLEGSCLFSSLTSSIFKGKRNGVETQAEGTNSGDVSPCEAPQLSSPPTSQPPPPSPTTAAPILHAQVKQSPAPSNREEAQAEEVVVSDSGPPLPSFNDIKLPDYLEKYLPREPTKPVQNIQGQEQVKTEVIGKMPSKSREVEAEPAVKLSPGLPDSAPLFFPGNSQTTHPTQPELKQPPAQPQDILSKNCRLRGPAPTLDGNTKKKIAKGFHKRPGKMVLFEKAQFSGQVYEIYRDVADATSLQLSPLISVKVVRGCWLLYEKPDFQGRSIALEEGVIELNNVWAESGLETEPQHSPPIQIGSIRLVVCDYSVPHIDLFTDPTGLGRVTSYHGDTIETGSFGIPMNTASIQVHSGVWLVFSDPGFQGMLAVLEKGEYPFPETWGFQSPFVGSLRPLKMDGFKVENASEVKAVVYERPGFEGPCLEIDSDVFGFRESDGGTSADGENLDSSKPRSVGSLKIIGGLWVGYSEPGFEGQQHILEEGEYLDSSNWGGSEQLLSIQPILSDFFSPHLKMFRDREFNEQGVNIDLTVPVVNMEDTGYGTKTQSIDVISGVWVLFEEPDFCGEAYIVEKGLYGCPEDWGALQPRVASAMPVVLGDFENTTKFKVQLFSEPGFQGSVLALEDGVASLQDGFSVASCKVLAGSWLAFDGQDFAGRTYVLEEGSYSDLKAMGCVQANSSILSLEPVGFEFSLPSITLFERCGLRGKRVILTDGTVNLQLAGGCSSVQSLLIEGGMWVLYEGITYRGAQILLKPGEVHDLYELSGWLRIGSLRPLTQKLVHFRLRNRQTGLMMSVTGDLDDVKLMRIQETEETDGFEQIWFYHNGYLSCKLLEDCCLSPSGSMTMAGNRVCLTPEQDNHLWSITPEGFICYMPTPNLVLEVKGGHNYDKNQVILSTLDPNKLQQQWDVEIL